MVSLTVGDVQGHEEWHLPTYDPRNENKYHYKLHSLDIYFWTQKDALDFVNGIRRVLPTNQVDVQDEPGPPPAAQHHQVPAEVSSVVQKLEKAAISEPANKNPTMIPGPPPAQTNSSSSSIPAFAPPPLSAVSAGNDSEDAAHSTTSPASFAPIAYNPAAPAAPEQIRHREKTPPPENGDLVNPLHARLVQDASTPFSPGLVGPGMPSNMSPLSPGIPPPQFHAPPGAPSFPGPPVGSPGFPPQHLQHQIHQGYGPTPMTPGHPGLQRAVTMPVAQPHGLASPAPLASPYTPSQPPPPQPPLPGTPAYTPTIPSYPTQQHPQVQAQPPPPPQQQHTTPPVTSPGLPPPPPGGYSNYSYTTQQGGGHSNSNGAGEYSIHQMAYRPTETEQALKYAPKKEVRGRLEENAGRLEKGVTGMLKRFEKKFG